MLRFYSEIVYPRLMSASLNNDSVNALRKRITAEVSGDILETGIGRGANLPFYPENVSGITAVDCFIDCIPESRVKVKLVKDSVCKMSFDDNTFDTVLSTFCLCSVENLEKALSEILRVLKPGGRLLFLEHGKAQRRVTRRLQDIFNPVYNTLALGCNINRDYTGGMGNAGFKVISCDVVNAAIFPRFLVGYAYIGAAEKPLTKEK